MAVDPMHAENEAQDVVNISNLTFTYPQRAGRNCWGTQAHQPMIVNARIVLSKPSFSTSDEDTLASHYSMDYAATTKRMTNLQSPADSTWVPVPELCVEIAGAIQSTDEGKVSTLKIDISLPKGTMLGSTVIVSMVEDAIGDSTSYFALRFEQLTCPVMIGLRDYERTRKQPIVLDVDVTGLWNDEADLYVEFEQTLIEILEATSYKTLEALANHIFKEMSVRFLSEYMPRANIRLRISKAKVLANEAVPSIEAYRSAAMLRKLR